MTDIEAVANNKSKQCRKRKANFSGREISTLVALVENNQSLLSAETKANANSLKKKKWEEFAHISSSQCGVTNRDGKNAK